MDNFSRNVLAFGTVGGAALVNAASDATFGNPDQPAEGAINANPVGLSDPGPRNPPLENLFSSRQNPPPWTSVTCRNGGWARQLTVDDLAISTAVAGVNMRLGPGGIHEMHWHLGRRVGDHAQRGLPRHGS